MTQYVINIGTFPNDGTGDPLRTAFNETNLNFDQIFAAGPVLSNVRIANNTILTTTTNGNLILAPNGIGVVQSNVHIVPNTSNIRNLGSADHRWSTIYAQYADITGGITISGNLSIPGDLAVGGNLSVTGDIIEIGNIVTDSKTIQLANTAGTANAANGSGITIGAADNIATFLYESGNNVWTTNIGLVVGGPITGISLAVSDATIYGNLNGLDGTFTGTVSANAFMGDGSQLTNIDANNITGLATVAYTGDYNDLINTPDFGNLTIDITTTGNISGSYFFGNGSLLTSITGANVTGNVANAAYADTAGTAVLVPAGNVTGLANVATSGDYNDLSGAPTNISAFTNDAGYITTDTANVISVNGLTGAVTLTIPTATSNLTNDSGFITSANIPTNVSAFTNDAGYITASVTGDFSATGNISGNYFVGNGAGLAGNLTMNSQWINNLSDPFDPQDAATKNYVDTVAQGLHVHTPALLATTQDLATYTGATVAYTQPAGAGNGVGATLTFTGNSLTALDGVSLIGAGANTRLLIKNEANAVFNGVYNYTSGTVLTRAADSDIGGDFDGGDFIFVQEGNVNADTGWVQTTNNVIIGTSNINFVQFSAAGAYSANTAAGLVLVGSQFSAKVDNNTTAFDGGGNIAVKAGANLTTPNIGDATGTSVSVTGNVSGNYFIGNGSQLTGLPASYTDANVITLLSNLGSNTISGTGNITTTGNISGAYILGNGSQLTGLSSSYSNANVATFLAAFGSNTISTTGNITSGNLRTTGLVSATGNITGGNITTTGALATTGAMSAGACVITGIATPAALTTNTNNWAPAGMSTAMVLRISATSAVNLTGIAAPSPAVNQLWYVYNVGAGQIAFVDDSTLSSVGNRFLFGNNRTLQTNEGLILWYDVASGGWRSPGVQV